MAVKKLSSQSLFPLHCLILAIVKTCFHYDSSDHAFTCSWSVLLHNGKRPCLSRTLFTPSMRKGEWLKAQDQEKYLFRRSIEAIHQLRTASHKVSHDHSLRSAITLIPRPLFSPCLITISHLFLSPLEASLAFETTLCSSLTRPSKSRKRSSMVLLSFTFSEIPAL